MADLKRILDKINVKRIIKYAMVGYELLSLFREKTKDGFLDAGEMIDIAKATLPKIGINIKEIGVKIGED